jgi:flagellar L-ring protein precursor FlgH
LRLRTALILVLGIAAPAFIPSAAWGRNKKAEARKSPLDEYIEAALGPETSSQEARKPGSLWSTGAALNDLGRDIRASRVHDLVTITVFESASAVSTGTSKTQRQSSAKATASVAGHTPRGLNPLVDLTTAVALDGSGTTSRHNELSTTVSARVTHVLPNGNLVVEGVRQIGVNSEQQTITLRGIVRSSDLTSENMVTSDRVGMLEVRVNGRGIVNDAIRRPNILYRILMGILPFLVIGYESRSRIAFRDLDGRPGGCGHAYQGTRLGGRGPR